MTHDPYREAMHKAAVANSKQLLLRRLSDKSLPSDCNYCQHRVRCVSLAPDRPVVCELQDAEASVDAVVPHDAHVGHNTGKGRAARQGAGDIDYDAEYYLRVHVIGLNVG